MYDELIKRLRSVKDSWQAEEESWMLQAADAIEELSEYVNTMRKLKCEGWYLQQTKFHDGCHAISTMPLPEPPKEE